MEIYDTNESFDFNKLVLTKPIAVPGGNYFIKCLVNNNPLFIQSPKCKTRQGITKIGKRLYTDLLFNNENESFIQWMENLENCLQQYIYKNKEKWFDGDMELHDIENYFSSPLKIYKSGKFYLLRTNINTTLGKPNLKIYDENENEIEIENINEDTNIINILEIQGIKCSARSFQIEIEIKQMMVMQKSNIFEKCIIKTNSKKADEPVTNEDVTNEEKEDSLETIKELLPEITVSEDIVSEVDSTNDIAVEIDIKEENDEPIKIPIITKDGLEEVEFNLDDLLESESIQIKKRNDVYYEMYKEARKKAKIARDLALSSYLEAKRIKNTYMLDDIKDSDDSDLELDYDDEN